MQQHRTVSEPAGMRRLLRSVDRRKTKTSGLPTTVVPYSRSLYPLMSNTAQHDAPTRNLDLEDGDSTRAGDGEGGSSDTYAEDSAKRKDPPKATSSLTGLVLLEAVAILGLLVTLARVRARCTTALATDSIG